MRSTFTAGSATRRLLILAVLALLAGSAPWWISPTSAHAEGGTTIVSDSRGWQWNPSDQSQPGQLFDFPREVTVDQTTNLVSQVVHVSWKNFSASDHLFTTPEDQATFYPVRIFECDTAQPTSPADCFGTLSFIEKHPGQGLVSGQTNSVQTVTGSDGTGAIDFPLLTAADNEALGCGPTHDCSLLIEPWTGGDYLGKASKSGPGTGDGSKPRCSDHSLDTTVDPDTYVGNFGSPGGAGANFWEKSCNWAQRIVVPLHFAPTPTQCPSRDADFQTEGSPLLSRAVDQWRTGVCRGTQGRGALQVGYSALSEYQARSDFNSGVTDLGLVSRPMEQAGRAVTYAPLAVSSIAVAYYVDDQLTGQPITDLRLSPRLLAKMLTQSYTNGLQTSCPATGQYPCAPEVAGNPDSVFSDPEFLTLNKKYTAADFQNPARPGDSFPSVMFGNSDSSYALTRWIAADPDARAFLAGKPDQNGMHVNNAYLPTKSPSYPLDQISANDEGSTNLVDNPGLGYKSLNAGMQNTWAPINGLSNVARQLVAGRSTAHTFDPACDGNVNQPVQGVCTHYPSVPAESAGNRSVFAIVSGGDAAAYRFPTAQLETRTGSGNFVGLNTASLSGAVSAMTPNPDKVTATVPTNADPDAYPLTMATYAMVPHCGLSVTKARAESSFLTYVASDAANQYGVQPGDLAPGYLALNTSQRAQTAAAADVAAAASRPCAAGEGPVRRGSNPANGDGAPSGHSDNPSSGGTDGGAGSDGSNGPGADGPPSGSAAPSSSDGPSATPSSSPSLDPAAFARPKPDSTGFAAMALPAILIAGAAALLLGPSALFVTRTEAGATLLRRTRGLLRL